LMHDCVRPARIQVEHHAQGHDGVVGALLVGLVDGENVGDLQDAGLDGLHVVAQARHLDDDGGVGRPGDVHLGLAGADRLDDDQVKAGGVQHLDGVGGGPGQATQVAPAGHTADENAGVAGQVPHTDAIAENGPAAERTGGVYGDNAHRPGRVQPTKVQRQAVDQRALAAARRPGHADDVRPAGVGKQCGQRRLGFGAVVFDEADGPGDSPPLPGQDPFDQLRAGLFDEFIHDKIVSIRQPPLPRGRGLG
jgi:hypothetical protein